MHNLLDIIKQSLLSISRGIDRDTIADDKVSYLVSMYDSLLNAQDLPASISKIHVCESIEHDMNSFEMNIQALHACPNLNVEEKVFNIYNYIG